MKSRIEKIIFNRSIPVTLNQINHIKFLTPLSTVLITPKGAQSSFKAHIVNKLNFEIYVQPKTLFRHIYHIQSSRLFGEVRFAETSVKKLRSSKKVLPNQVQTANGKTEFCDSPFGKPVRDKETDSEMSKEKLMELGESNKDKLKLLREEACKSFTGLDDIGGA